MRTDISSTERIVHCHRPYLHALRPRRFAANVVLSIRVRAVAHVVTLTWVNVNPACGTLRSGQRDSFAGAAPRTATATTMRSARAQSAHSSECHRGATPWSPSARDAESAIHLVLQSRPRTARPFRRCSRRGRPCRRGRSRSSLWPIPRTRPNRQSHTERGGRSPDPKNP